MACMQKLMGNTNWLSLSAGQRKIEIINFNLIMTYNNIFLKVVVGKIDGRSTETVDMMGK